MRLVNKISGKLALCFYIFTLYHLWHLCQYGGAKRHSILMAIGFSGCIVMLVLWMVSKSITGKRDENTKRTSRKILYLEMTIFIAASIWFVGKIVYSAIPYHGALSWKILLTTESSESDGIIFQSQDKGVTWDEADRAALEDERRYTHEEVFSKLRRRVND